MDKGFIKESQKSEDGMKRYTITEEGKAFLKNVKDVVIDFGSLKFMIPTLISQFSITPREDF